MLKRLHINLPQDLFSWVKSIAFHEGRSISNFITIKLYSIQEDYDNATQGTKNSQAEPTNQADHVDPNNKTT